MQLSVPIGSSLMAAAMGQVNPKMTYQTCTAGLPSQHQFAHRLPSLACSMMFNKQSSQRISESNGLMDFCCRTNQKVCSSLQAVSPQNCMEIPMQPSVSFKDFFVSVSTKEDGAIKNVAAAQPLPRFRRMKGGRTPEIPKEIALHLIGPSKVKRETIKKIINCTVAEYVQKESLNT